MASPAKPYDFTGLTALVPENIEQLDQMLRDLYGYLTQSPLGTGDTALDLSGVANTGLLYLDVSEALKSLSTVGSVYIGTTGVPAVLSAATGNALISGGVGAVPSFGKIVLTTHVSGILPIANGGTNKATWVAGSVVVATATDVLGEDNAGLFFDVANNRLGVGIASPDNALDVRATSPILAGYHSDTAGFAALRFFEGTTLRSSVQHIGTTFATVGRRDDLELVTLQATGDVVILPNSAETARFTVGGGLTLSTPLTLGNGGTGSSAFTAGSIVFSNGTLLTQDNANLFWDDTNNRLGIGGAPSYKLDVQSTSGTIGIRSNSNTASDVLFYGTGTVTGNLNLFDANITASGSVNVNISNQHTTSGEAKINCQVAGASAGDPFYLMTVNGVTNWSFGIDNSDGDRFKLGPTANPSQANQAIVIDTSGNIGIGTTALPGSGTASLIFADGTIPATMGTNTAGIYANDVSGTVNMYAINEAGESTRLSFPAPQTYTETNVTTDRAFDANATSLDEIADVLGSLIVDLRARGVVA